MTDLAITTARNETYNFEVRVLADLTMIQGKLQATFPDASIRLSQIRDHFVVEGEARDPAQIARIIQTIRAYLTSVYIEQGRTRHGWADKTGFGGPGRSRAWGLGSRAGQPRGPGRASAGAASCSPGCGSQPATGRRAAIAAGQPGAGQLPGRG